MFTADQIHWQNKSTLWGQGTVKKFIILSIVPFYFFWGILAVRYFENRLLFLSKRHE